MTVRERRGLGAAAGGPITKLQEHVSTQLVQDPNSNAKR